ncbi:hypothetical protein ACLOJK_035373 [Asimina triloba]
MGFIDLQFDDVRLSLSIFNLTVDCSAKTNTSGTLILVVLAPSTTSLSLECVLVVLAPSTTSLSLECVCN